MGKFPATPFRLLTLAPSLLWLLACQAQPTPSQAAAPVDPASANRASTKAAAPTPTPPSPPQATVVFLGDSLTAGFGLDADQAFPALIETELAAAGKPVRVINAGVSGDTTAGGLARLDWLLRQQPNILVVGLGGNDGLRGLDLAASEANLREIVSRGKKAGCRVLLLGMLIPPNYGGDYTRAFAAIYPRVAQGEGVALVPFLLEGVGGDPKLNQADGIHPTAEGHRIVARTVLQALDPLLTSALSDLSSKQP